MPKTNHRKEKKSSSSVPIVDSLATALRILDYFTIREPELSLRALSEKSGLYKSRIHRLCSTLVALGFLTRMPSSSYRLGPKLMTLGKVYERTNSLITLSKSIMKQLADSTGESVALFQLDGLHCICLSREYGTSSLVFDIQEGEKMELHASAAGRIFMSYGPKELSETVLNQPTLKKFTSETITNPKTLAKKLSSIKKRGYEVNRGERELEVAAIAAPVFNYEGKIESVLTVVGPVQRFSEDRESEIAKKLIIASSKISELLGASLQ
jgi:DNA-binding IclR family transcriptional regulator